MKDNSFENYFAKSEIDAIYDNAVALVADNKSQEALKEFSKIIAVQPFHRDALIHLGCLNDNLGRFEEALYFYDICKEKYPDYYLVYYNRAIVLYKLNKINMAIVDYSKALELNPSHKSSIETRAICYAEIGLYDLAIDDLSKLIKLNFTEYKHKGMITTISHNQQDKAKKASSLLLRNGFYLRIIGSSMEKIIILPRYCEYRIVLKFPKLHIGKTVKRHLRQYSGSYELKFGDDLDIIFSQCQEHYDDLYMKNKRFLFSTMKQKTDSPKAISVGLYLNGTLVAGDIGVQIGRVYSSYTGYHNVSNAGNVLLIMLANYLKNHDFAFLDFGSDTTTRFETYKYRMGAEKISNEEYQELFHSANGTENSFFKKRRH